MVENSIMYNFNLINADTDSIMVAKPDGQPFSPEEQKNLINELNSLFPEHISWEDDGYYKRCIVLKAKNYILLPENQIKYKTRGSSIKTSTKELAMKELMTEVIEAMVYNRLDTIPSIYHKYVIEATNPTDIMRWSSKKNASEAVLNCMGYEKYTPEQLKKKEIRPNETNIWDAIKMEELVQAGDRFFLYPTILGSTSTFRTFKNGKTKETKIYKYGFRQAKAWNKEDHDVEQLLKRVYDTLSIFETVLDIDEYLDYSKVKNKDELKKLLTIE